MDTVFENYNTAILCAVLVAIPAMLQSLVGAGHKNWFFPYLKHFWVRGFDINRFAKNQ
ncbi:MAG: hypothetical protein WA888_04290 [Burkholderiaceae bacterium]